MIVTVVWIVIILLFFYRYTHYEFANDKSYCYNVYHFWRLMFKFFKATNTTRLDVHHEIAEYFPRFAHFQFFKIDILAVYDPEILRKIFLAQNACERPSSHVYQQPYTLLAAEYPYWKKARKEINPAFSINVMKTFLPVFGEETDKIIKKMNEKNLDGEEFNLVEHMTELVINAGAITIFNLHDKIPLAQKMAEPIDELMAIIMRRLTDPLMHIPFFFNMTKDSKKFDEIRNFVYGITDDALKESINNRRNRKQIDENDNLEKKRVKVEYLIDILASNENFDEEEILQHIGFMLIAAVDTTITMLTSTLVYLAIHQDVQEKAYNEIMTVFKDDSVELDVDNLTNLTYLKMCIDESLRLFTPVPQMPRTIVNEKIYVGLGEKLKIGAQIHILTSVLHRRKDIWGEDADEFKPERFSPEEIESRDPYAYAPFGHGPRMCIGQKYAILSGKVELMKLLKAYKFHTNLTMKDLKMNHMISVRFLDPPKVWIEKRK